MKPELKDPSDGYRGWEYAYQGDYHRNLDLNWRYAPTYLKKMKWVRNYIDKLSVEAKILDAGCGEGVLVEEYTKMGRNIEGLDLNYSSEYVQRGDIRHMPYSDGSFDVVLLLDVFEHLAYLDQPGVLQEIHRVLGKNSHLVISIPNLAHLSSRFSFSFFGRLHRTDSVTNHIGERPFWENRKLLIENGFHIDRCKGVTLTVPILYRVIAHYARYLRWLHDLIDPLAIPSLAMLNIFFCSSLD
jgi:SAM-dependent methyltransferase